MLAHIILISALALGASACSLVKKIAGADIDSEQYELARTAKMLEVRLKASDELSKKIIRFNRFDSSDVIIYLNKTLLTKALAQYTGVSGWLDDATSYKLNKAELELNNGSAIVSLDLAAHNSSYNVDVALKMDCLLTFNIEKSDLVMRLEPFNINPDVSTGILLKVAEGTIQNLIKINLAQAGKGLPEIKIPVDIRGKLDIEQSRIEVRDKINLNLISPKRSLEYELKLVDVSIFAPSVIVRLNIEKITVK